MNTEIGLRITGPDVKPEEVEAMIEFLRGKGWLKAAEIATQAGVSERKMRAMAEHSDGRILSGQAGYRYLDRTTPIDEVDQAATWLESQGKKMLARAAVIRRRYHRYARENEPGA